jgi:predicted MarR family transcription regulator
MLSTMLKCEKEHLTTLAIWWLVVSGLIKKTKKAKDDVVNILGIEK